MALTATVEPEVKSIRLDYTAPAGAATVTFSRTGPSGVAATVRSWQDAVVVPGPVIARDFEAPIGVPLLYTATAENSAGSVVDTQTTTITVSSAGCADTWLTDLARVANSMVIAIESLPELEHPVPNTVHEIIARRSPIVTSDIAHVPAFELSFLTPTLDERDQARAVLGNGVPVLLRTPPEDGIGNLYFSVLGFREQRIVALGTVPDRRFVVSARQVQRPDPGLYAPVGVSTYNHVKAGFATYAALKAGRVSYDSVLYDWAGAEPSDVLAWPPDDV
ncbi:MAG TPA: hypothetical protein VJN72_08055 [Gaiellales bacterium]|nr:hypothetical protein [Gaiellales bacterium]